MKRGRRVLRRGVSVAVVLLWQHPCVLAQSALRSRSTAMKSLYTGPEVHSRGDLEAYTGLAATQVLVGDLRQRGYVLNYEQLAVNYGESIEFQLRRRQVLLCPQTVDFLYRQYTPPDVRYQPGTRPVLEQTVREVTATCHDQQDKALALMRFCRDLYRKRKHIPFEDYVYGGTEEQLISKGEILCEALGRLFVSLCEVAGIPARIVMHDLGGHICAEARVEGRWGYLDPTTGVYALHPDGTLASTWEIWQDPALLRRQDSGVRADVSKRWTWEERVTKCEQKYFSPQEVIGFENYSLADRRRYNYGQLTYAEAREAGLFVINDFYCAVADRVFGLKPDVGEYLWPDKPLRVLPLAYRHDGFSPWFRRPPLTRRDVERLFVDPFAGSRVDTLVWGLGPGSVFCFATQAGDRFGRQVTAEQWKALREGDRWVDANLQGLLDSGAGPLRIAVARGHQLGLKVFARLEMNHEYGPPDPTNWLWIAFVGSFNKQHPEYRIPGTVLLDFKHPEVRNFKLAILREAVEAGADGLALDFAVYPPFFEKPRAETMTHFLRDVRAMTREIGAGQHRQVAVMVRVPTPGAKKLGLDWRTWMREKLVDCVVPTDFRGCDRFDVRVGEFVRLAKETGCKVYGCLWHSLGFVDTDPRPDGRQRYDKPKTRGMFASQALLFHRAGVDGLQLAMSADEWNHRPWYNDLADPARVLFADKHYMVDPRSYLPVRFALPADRSSRVCNRLVLLRLADDPAAAAKAGYMVTATLVFYSRKLLPGESLKVFVNGHGPLTVSGRGGGRKEPDSTGAVLAPRGEVVYQRDWWKRGEHKLTVNPKWWKPGTNTIRFAYSTDSPPEHKPLALSWVDVLLHYRKKQRRGGRAARGHAAPLPGTTAAGPG